MSSTPTFLTKTALVNSLALMTTKASVVKRKPEKTRAWFSSTIGISPTYHILEQITELMLVDREF